MAVRIFIREKLTGKGIPFVLVRIESPDFVFVDDTDMKGMAEFPSVHDGKYIIKIRHKDYRPYTEKTYISNHSIINIKLQRAYD